MTLPYARHMQILNFDRISPEQNTKNHSLTPYADVRTYVFYDPYFTNTQLVVVNGLVDILY